MELFNILFNTILSMFVIIGVGALTYKLKLLTESYMVGINSLLINLILPCLIISNFCIGYTKEIFNNLLITFGLGAITYLISAILAYVLYKKDHNLERFGIIFANTGFIGIAIIGPVLGQEYIVYMSSHLMLIYILVWTLGSYTLTNTNKYISIKNLLKNPTLNSCFIGLFIFLLNIDVPDIILNPLLQVGNASTPISLIIMGCYVVKSGVLSGIRNLSIYYVSFIRLILCPVIMGFILFLVPNEYYELKMMTLITAATPVGANMVVFAQLFNKSPEKASLYVVYSTILCLITLPIIVTIFSNLWV